MKLSQLDLAGYGQFSDEEKATFTIKKLNLPTPWEYIYQNRKMLLKVDQHGPVYAQAYPPNDIMLFTRDKFQRYSSWLVWLNSPSFTDGAFTNFYRPTLGGANPAAEPDELEITFSPTRAIYKIESQGLRCQTEFFIPAGQCAVCMKVSLTNLRAEPLRLSAIPAFRTYVNKAMLAPWDKPEWYLKTGFCKESTIGFSTQLLAMDSIADNRRCVVLWSDKEDATAAEISYEKFVGGGTFEAPQAVYENKLRLTINDAKGWRVYEDRNTLYAYPPVNALKYDIELAKGQTKSFRQVLAMVPNGPAGAIAKLQVAVKPAELLNEHICQKQLQKLQQNFDKLANIRTIKTPDSALDQYTNQWLPLQMDWVCSLDRGWPTGMRGSRDSANDFTAMVALDPKWCREVIETMIECQQTDGWFPRQYSAIGRSGKHDMRKFVDAGNFFFELLYDYLCYSKDWELLDKKLPWLDSDEENTVLEHTLKLIEYFICDENIGEHGLCKIGAGDWLDAVNRAGMEGRGESVMVTNQTIITLTKMSKILDKLQGSKKISADKADSLQKLYGQKKNEFAENLRKHAFNKDGFFNSVFNDDGKWIFSDNDPDGKRRVYGPANWFSISSGVAVPDLVESLLKELDVLKCEQGYRLFYPALGKVMIDKVGRAASGDLPAGRSENATAYNHGSHGFLARALAVAGKGDLLYEVLNYMLPYDQDKHPVDTVMVTPYGITNCYERLPLFMGRGKMVFLTGTIPYAMRTVYEWLFGIEAMLDGLTIDPCIPSRFEKLEAKFEYLGQTIELEINNPNKAQSQVKTMVFNDQDITQTETDAFSGRKLFIAGDELFTKPNNKIVVTL